MKHFLRLLSATIPLVFMASLLWGVVQDPALEQVQVSSAFKHRSEREQKDAFKKLFVPPNHVDASRYIQGLHKAFLVGGYKVLFDEAVPFAQQELLTMHEQVADAQKHKELRQAIASAKGDLSDQEEFLLWYSALYAPQEVAQEAQQQLQTLGRVDEDMAWQDAKDAFEAAGAKAAIKAFQSADWLKGEREELIEGYKNAIAPFLTKEKQDELSAMVAILEERAANEPSDHTAYATLRDAWDALDEEIKKERAAFYKAPTAEKKAALIKKEHATLEAYAALRTELEELDAYNESKAYELMPEGKAELTQQESEIPLMDQETLAQLEIQDQRFIEKNYNELVAGIKGVLLHQDPVDRQKMNVRLSLLQQAFQGAQKAQDQQKQLDVIEKLQEIKASLPEMARKRLERQAAYEGTDAYALRLRSEAKKTLEQMKN